MSKAAQVLLETYDETYAPPDQELLRVSYVPGGNGVEATLHLDIVKCGKLNKKTGDYDYEQLGTFACNLSTFEDALAFLKKHARSERLRV